MANGRQIANGDLIFAKSYDVIVLGATECGVMAAVAAARHGLSVLLVSDSNRLGGMSGWGINQMDLLVNKSPGMIGGLPREFFTRIAKLERAEATFQRWHRFGGPGRPSWYRRAFGRFVAAERNIATLFNATLDSVNMAGVSIASVVLSTVKYSASVYVDATATGDLIQQVLTSKSIGREGNALYSELGAGVLTPQVWTGPSNVDPYVTPGDSNSGLLFGIDSGAIGTVGDGDGRVMGSGYRLFVTSVSAEKIPFPAPNMATYDPMKFELIARAFADNPTYWNLSTNAFTRMFSAYDVGVVGGENANGPTYLSYMDLNSNGAMSTNYPNSAECLEYITASPARRAVIAENAKQYLLGLLYWILNSGDSRIPANLITQLSAYGLSNKELTEYGGFSPQFYVREGCRAVGDFVLDQSHAIVQNGYPDYVAWGAYDFDCHIVRRVVSGGVAKTEGGFNTAATGAQVGFPIPYRVLLPKRTECINLLCPGGPSVSWFVNTACRAIPITMMLGEAAGHAAFLAVRGNQAVHDVDVSRIQRMQDLMKVWGGIVISADGTYASGTRVESGAGTPFADYTSRWGWLGGGAKSCAAMNARKVKYSPNLFRSGMYRALFIYPPDETTGNGGTGRATNLTVNISHADGTTTRTVNQNYAGGSSGFWDDLGTFYMRAGQSSSDYVELDPTSADGIVTDGGVKFVPVDEAA